MAYMDGSRSTEKNGSSFQIVASEDFGSGPTKVCKTCGIEKPLSEYHKDRATQDGHKHICKSCKSKYDTRRKPKVNNDMMRSALVEAWENIIRDKYL